jgi:hypothetical protein
MQENRINKSKEENKNMNAKGWRIFTSPKLRLLA